MRINNLIKNRLLIYHIDFQDIEQKLLKQIFWEEVLLLYLSFAKIPYVFIYIPMFYEKELSNIR